MGKEAEQCESRERPDQEHLDELPDGSGCTEIWEHLSERRTSSESD